jgi:hypothetical protein
MQSVYKQRLSKQIPAEMNARNNRRTVFFDVVRVEELS